MGEPLLGLLPTILRTGFIQLEDVSPVAVIRYVKVLRALSPDQRIQATAQHNREALRFAFRNVNLLEKDVPPYGAWRALAEARYGALPQALKVRDPERVTSIDGVNLAQMASAVGYALETAGARWCLSGALARCAFGEPRPVADLEFLATVDKDSLPALTKQLGESFWSSQGQLEEAAAERKAGILYHLATLTQIRLVPAGGEFLDSVLSRRIRVEGSASGRLWVQSREDSVLQGLVAWRDAEEGEELHWRDVALLLAAQPEMDAAYVDAWAQKLDVVDTLREARAQAGAEAGGEA
ncbi:MAG TPA: hypothetical protein VGK67_12760 [Myxococcales bacterium]|jgi:hypothetical protein